MGVFVNAIVYDIDHLVLPGDRVAFIDRSSQPASFMLGVHQARKAKKTTPDCECRYLPEAAS
jgi:hypothetical protein